MSDPFNFPSFMMLTSEQAHELFSTGTLPDGRKIFDVNEIEDDSDKTQTIEGIANALKTFFEGLQLPTITDSDIEIAAQKGILPYAGLSDDYARECESMLGQMLSTPMEKDDPCSYPDCDCFPDQTDDGLSNLVPGPALVDFLNEVFGGEEQLEMDIETMFMPSWASRRVNPDMLETMTHLSTRDGRKIGNAVIFDITFNRAIEETFFHVITDACNILSLTYYELGEYFHAPEFIAVDFPNNDAAEEAIMKWYEARI